MSDERLPLPVQPNAFSLSDAASLFALTGCVMRSEMLAFDEAWSGWGYGMRDPTIRVRLEISDAPDRLSSTLRTVRALLGLGRRSDDIDTSPLETVIELAVELQRRHGIPVSRSYELLESTSQTALAFVPYFGDPLTARVALEALEHCLHEGRRSGASRPSLFHIMDRLGEQLKPFAVRSPASQSLVEALSDRQVPVRPVAGSILQAGLGKRAFWFDGSVGDDSSAAARQLLDDPTATARVLTELGFPVLETTVVSDLDEARLAADRLDLPLLAWPDVLGDLAEPPRRIYSYDDLIAAFQSFRALGRCTLLSQIAKGRHFRFSLIAGKVTEIVERQPPTIVGDGFSTAEELIRRANEARAPYELPASVVIDDGLRSVLAGQGMSLLTVVPSGTRVRLRDWPGRDALLTKCSDALVHFDVRRAIEDVASIFRLGSLSVDIVATDLSLPWTASGATIVAVNHRPESLGHGAALAELAGTISSRVQSALPELWVFEDPAVGYPDKITLARNWMVGESELSPLLVSAQELLARGLPFPKVGRLRVCRQVQTEDRLELIKLVRGHVDATDEF